MPPKALPSSFRGLADRPPMTSQHLRVLGEHMSNEKQVRSEISEFINRDGLVMFNKEKSDGNDAPHKTGFYIAGLVSKGWLNDEDVALFINALDSITTRDGRLLRHENTKLPFEPRLFWQPSSRDQYQAVFAALGLCWQIKGHRAAQSLALSYYREIRWARLFNRIPMCSKDILSPQHWYMFGLCVGLPQANWFKQLAGVSEVVSALFAITRDRGGPTNILSYLRLITVAAFGASSYFHTLARRILDSKFSFEDDMTLYWTRQGGPPIHKLFLGEE